MFDTEPIPPGLDAMPPGPVLAALLSSIDVDRVSGYDRVVVLRAQQRMGSHFQAQMYAAMVAVADHMDLAEFADDPELAWEAASAEIRAALRLTRRAADAQLGSAVELRKRLPLIWTSLATGAIDPARARVIASGTSHLDETTARQVAGLVIDDAPRLTTGELGAGLRLLCIEASVTPQQPRPGSSRRWTGGAWSRRPLRRGPRI